MKSGISMMYISFDKTFKDEKKTISSIYLYIYNFKISLKFSFFLLDLHNNCKSCQVPIHFIPSFIY